MGRIKFISKEQLVCRTNFSAAAGAIDYVGIRFSILHRPRYSEDQRIVHYSLGLPAEVVDHQSVGSRWGATRLAQSC